MGGRLLKLNRVPGGRGYTVGLDNPYTTHNIVQPIHGLAKLDNKTAQPIHGLAGPLRQPSPGLQLLHDLPVDHVRHVSRDLPRVVPICSIQQLVNEAQRVPVHIHEAPAFARGSGVSPFPLLLQLTPGLGENPEPLPRQSPALPQLASVILDDNITTSSQTSPSASDTHPRPVLLLPGGSKLADVSLEGLLLRQRQELSVSPAHLPHPLPTSLKCHTAIGNELVGVRA